jgi:hypothetical protein
VIYDEIIPGAAGYVRRVHDAGATICYLTGRDEPGMGAGTRAALRQNDFPWDEPRVELIMKATFEEPDESHKGRAIECVRALGRVVAAFDNEPELVNLLADAFPEATVVRVDSLHSPKKIRAYPHIPVITEFALPG